MKSLTTLASILALLIHVGFSGIASAASFDCEKAEAVIEKLICSDSQISELDSRLGEIYAAARTQSSNSDQIKHEQRDWIKNVRNKCTDIDCFRNAYAARISVLASLAPPTLAHSTSEAQTTTASVADAIKPDTPVVQSKVEAEPQATKIAVNVAAQPPRVVNLPPSTENSAAKESEVGLGWGIWFLALAALFGLALFISSKKRKLVASNKEPGSAAEDAETKISEQKISGTSREDEVKQRYQQMLNEQLFEALAAKQYGKVESLVSKGADINAPSQIKPNMTPIGQAASTGDINAVTLLIKLGADVNTTSQRTDNSGFTPLHYAAKAGNIDAVTILLGRGADLNAKTGNGEDALQLAEQAGHKSVANLLIEIMATGKLPSIDELHIGKKQEESGQELVDSDIDVSRIEIVTKPRRQEPNSMVTQTPLAKQSEIGGGMRITGAIVEWLKEKGWEERPEVNEENQSSSTGFLYNVADDLSVRCFFDAAEKAGFITLTMYFIDPKIPVSRIDEVTKYTNEVNVRNVFGQLAVMKDKTLRWYSGIDVEGATIETRLIENMLGAGLSTLERRLPQFMAVCFSGKTAEEALEIEAE